LGGVILIIGVALYFLPFIVALNRNHHQGGAVFVINLFLGWTVLGWVVALAMACSSTSPAQQQAPYTNRRCPYCAEYVQSLAVVCRYCGRDIEPAPMAPMPVKYPGLVDQMADAWRRFLALPSEIHLIVNIAVLALIVVGIGGFLVLHNRADHAADAYQGDRLFLEGGSVSVSDYEHFLTRFGCPLETEPFSNAIKQSIASLGPGVKVNDDAFTKGMQGILPSARVSHDSKGDISDISLANQMIAEKCAPK